MDVGIIGGGAIGLLFGAYLAETNDVTIYTKTVRQADILNKNGISMQSNQISKTVQVRANVLHTKELNHDLLIIAVKQYHLDDVMEKIKESHISTPSILFLQNGMGHIKTLRNLQFKNILIGIVEHGAMKIGDNRIIHTGIGTTKLSSYKGVMNEVLSVFEQTSNTFPYVHQQNWMESMKLKLIINAVINPLTSLYRIENGELISNRFFFDTMKSLFEEIVSVISIKEEEEVWEQLRWVCTKTAKNRSSMLKDIEEGRPTEIEAILGYVLKQAKDKEKSLAITSFVYESILGLEKRRFDRRC